MTNDDLEYTKETNQAISEVEQDKAKKFSSTKALFDDLNDTKKTMTSK